MSFRSYLRSAFGLAEKGPDMTVSGSDSATFVSSGGRSLIDQETRWELRGNQGGRTYREMRLDDPHIRGLRRAQNLPLVRASAEIEPADPDDADAVAKADFVRSVLIDDYPFGSFVSDSMLALDYGFAAFEIVWYREADSGRIRCRLELRPSSSIAPSDIYVKDGAIDHVVQRPLDGKELTIDGSRLVWFCHDKEGVSFQGTPILRSMYRPWRIKREMEQELPSAVRRLAGIPDITYTGTPPAETKAQLEEMGRRIGLSADGYALHPDTITVQLLTGNASVSDILEAIKAQDQALSSVCQAQVFDLGTSNAGSRALGTTLSDLFANGVQAEATYREGVINATGGVIHQLVAYNFPSDDNRPRLRFGNVQAVDMRSFAQGLALLGQSFQSLPPDLQEWARRELNAPEGPPVTQVTVPDAPPAEPSDDQALPEEQGAKASEPCGCGGHGSMKLAEDRPFGESFVALYQLEEHFDAAKTAVREATQGTRDKLIAELARRAETARKAGKLDQFVAGSPPMVEKLTAEIKAVMTGLYDAGREQVADELDRQRESLDEPTLATADPKKIPRVAKAILPDSDDAIEAQAKAMARGIAVATQSAAAMAASRVAAGVPLDPADFIETVTRESDGAALRLGAAVADLMQLGREDEANAQAADIAIGGVSAILDEATCDACREADGYESEDLDEIAALAPNPACEGGSRCRCFAYYLLKGVQEAAS